MRREAMELTSDAQSLLAKVQQAVKNAGKQIEKEEKKQIKIDCNALQKLLMKFRVDKVTEQDVEEIRNAKQQLENSSARVRGFFA
jgi:molecular chaperone DnaK